MNIIFLSSTEADIAIEQMLRILGASNVSPVDSDLSESRTTLFSEGATAPEISVGDRVVVTLDGTDKRLWPQFRDADTFKGTVTNVFDWDVGRGLRVKVDGVEPPCEDCEGFLFYADQCEPIADEPETTAPKFKQGDRVVVTLDAADKGFWPEFFDGVDEVTGVLVQNYGYREAFGEYEVRVKVDNIEDGRDGHLFFLSQLRPPLRPMPAAPETKFKIGDRVILEDRVFDLGDEIGTVHDIAPAWQFKNTVYLIKMDDPTGEHRHTGCRVFGDKYTENVFRFGSDRVLTALEAEAEPETATAELPKPNTPEERAQLMFAEAAGKTFTLIRLDGEDSPFITKPDNIWNFRHLRYEIDGEAFIESPLQPGEPPLKTGDRVIVTVEEVDVLGPAGTELAGTFLEYEDEDGNFCVRLAGVGDDWFRPHQVRRAENNRE